MDIDTLTDTVIEQAKLVDEIKDALAEMITDVLPQLSREIDARFAARDATIAGLDVGMTDALARAHTATSLAIALLSNTVNERLDFHIRDEKQRFDQLKKSIQENPPNDP